MTMLNADLNVDGDHTTIRFIGDLDIASAPDFVALAKTALSRPEMRVLALDLGEVEFIDSSGVNALVLARRTCIDHDAELHLRTVSRRVHEVLKLTQLLEAFGLPDGDAGRC